MVCSNLATESLPDKILESWKGPVAPVPSTQAEEEARDVSRAANQSSLIHQLDLQCRRHLSEAMQQLISLQVSRWTIMAINLSSSDQVTRRVHHPVFWLHPTLWACKVRLLLGTKASFMMPKGVDLSSPNILCMCKTSSAAHAVKYQGDVSLLLLCGMSAALSDSAFCSILFQCTDEISIGSRFQ